MSGGIEEYEQRIRDAGCSFRQELHADPQGQVFIFVDTEGARVEIRQR